MSSEYRAMRRQQDPQHSALSTQHSDHFVMTMRPTPRGRDRYGRSPLYRMKGFLKVMLRCFGWQCVSLRPKWLEEEMGRSKQ